MVYVFTRRIKRASRDVRKKESELLSIVQEVFSSIRVVKAFAREDYEERRFERRSLDNVETTLRARGLKMALSPVVEIIVATGTCLMLAYGARLVIAGQLTAGALVVFLLYLGKMYKPMRDLSKMTDTVSKAAVGFERIREVLETEGGVRDLPRACQATGFKGRIEFKAVSFGYTPDQLILKDVSFAIEPGQIAAFVGPTGGGKTTIINLIARFYDPVSGTVTIDGTDIGASRFNRCGIRSALCCRTRSSSTHRSCRTSRTADRKRTVRRLSAPRNWPTPTSSSRKCRMATTRWSASAASPCPGASANASRSPGR